jgi:hypothetical protein
MPWLKSVEPSFPLIYISHNITKLGHDAKARVIIIDITERKAAEEKIVLLARTDSV